MEQQNIFEKLFLGKKHKKQLIILYVSLFILLGIYFLGEILGRTLFYITH